MRRILATTMLIAATALAGCGSDESVTTADDSPTPAPEVIVVGGSAGGGDEVADQVTVLEDEAALTAYAGQFHGELVDEITGAAERIDVPDGHVLVAAVVAIGCDVPPGAEVSGEGADAEFVPDKVASPHPECYVAVTSVALAAVPA